MTLEPLAAAPKLIALIGGLRTYTLSPKLEFSTAGAQVAPIDVSRTSANVFGRGAASYSATRPSGSMRAATPPTRW